MSPINELEAYVVKQFVDLAQGHVKAQDLLKAMIGDDDIANDILTKSLPLSADLAYNSLGSERFPLLFPDLLQYRQMLLDAYVRKLTPRLQKSPEIKVSGLSKLNVTCQIMARNIAKALRETGRTIDDLAEALDLENSDYLRNGVFAGRHSITSGLLFGISIVLDKPPIWFFQK